ncbi:unnamed protein product [Ranitomeya imitator]|uniref:Rho-GAP domain-containing protein n=1 Tax=Ranitomeya imitator TaxID=111125 RepID=A0ABN9LMD5_9NEOB|nr:unnamed protein product [Ranitomeya imitator]
MSVTIPLIRGSESSLSAPQQIGKSEAKCQNCRIGASHIISMLPLHHKNVFNYLISFLRGLLNNALQNHLDVNILASIFGNLLLRPLPDHSTPSNLDKRKCQEFIQQFLVATESP